MNWDWGVEGTCLITFARMCFLDTTNVIHQIVFKSIRDFTFYGELPHNWEGLCLSFVGLGFSVFSLDLCS